MGSNFCRDFFRPKMESKLVFGQGVSIRECVFITLVTHHLKDCHELIHGFTIHDTLFTFTGIQEELTGHRINNTACQVLVLHGVRLITLLLYDGQITVSTIVCFDWVSNITVLQCIHTTLIVFYGIGSVSSVHEPRIKFFLMLAFSQCSCIITDLRI
jgi:hypothetical protein